MGAWLLVLGRSLQQRLESAYYFVLALLGLSDVRLFL